MTLRHRRKDGKVSWALVAFGSDDSLAKAIEAYDSEAGKSALSMKGADKLVVRKVDAAQAAKSTGAMKELLVANVQKWRKAQAEASTKRAATVMSATSAFKKSIKSSATTPRAPEPQAEMPAEVPPPPPLALESPPVPPPAEPPPTSSGSASGKRRRAPPALDVGAPASPTRPALRLPVAASPPRRPRPDLSLVRPFRPGLSPLQRTVSDSEVTVGADSLPGTPRRRPPPALPPATEAYGSRTERRRAAEDWLQAERMRTARWNGMVGALLCQQLVEMRRPFTSSTSLRE